MPHARIISVQLPVLMYNRRHQLPVQFFHLRDQLPQVLSEASIKGSRIEQLPALKVKGDNRMRICPKCGTPSEEDSRFCPSCGTSLEQSSHLFGENTLLNPDESEAYGSLMPSSEADTTQKRAFCSESMEDPTPPATSSGEAPTMPIWCTRDPADLPADLSNVTLDDLEETSPDPLSDTAWRRKRDLSTYSSSKYIHGSEL